MSFLDMALNDIPELDAVTEGEYQLRIMSAEVKTSQKTGGNYLSVRFEVADEVAKDINHVIMLPDNSKSEKEVIVAKNRLKYFYEAFGIDYISGSVNLETLPGLTGYAMMTVEESDQYGRQNRIKQFIGRA